MSGTKIVIIVLVVVAVLFVVLVVRGAGNDHKGPTTANSSDPSSAPIASGINNLFGSHLPKFDPAYLRPQLTSFDLQKQAGYSVQVMADDSHPFRQLKVKVQPAKSPSSSCALVIFRPTNPPEEDMKESRSDHPKIKDQNDVTFMIPKGGGKLDIGRSGPSISIPCTVTLQ
jgi:hypothetical protein